MKLAVVVQRYGEAINGGAELHARYIAEHLAKHADVEVLTTCAVDYVSWRNELAEGVEHINNVVVRRFRVSHERDTLTFARRSQLVFERPHSLADELEWIDAQGPASRALVQYIAKHASEYDYCLFFSYRYFHAYHGARASAGRAILVPTAERDATIGLSMFRPVFRGMRALMYNSPEEREMIQAAAANQDVPSVVVGIGSDVPANPQAGRFRRKFDIQSPFAVYVGRIDENKGCKELFDFFDGYLQAEAGRLSLVLIGNSLLPIPSHPRIRHLGFLDDADKFDAMSASELLVMPSYFESLSMVALEAWALGKPVLANAKCDVLKGQSIRSNAGLYYDTRAEFIETLRAMEQNRWLNAALGRNGRQFFREHYDWNVIERKYLDMFDRLRQEATPRQIEPLPGWFERRRTDCPPGAEVLASLPAGPVRRSEAGSLPPPPPQRAAERTSAADSPGAQRFAPQGHRHGRPQPKGSGSRRAGGR